MSTQESNDTSHERDQALLWLNGHLGETVNATVDVAIEGVTVTLLGVEGKLSHWRQGEQADQVAALDPSGLREDIIGSYQVGGAALDLSLLPDATATRAWTVRTLAEELAGAQPVQDQGVVVEFADGITLTITRVLEEEMS